MEVVMFLEEGSYMEHRVIVASSNFPNMVIVRLKQLLAQVTGQEFGNILVLGPVINKQGKFVGLTASHQLSGIVFRTLNLRIVEEELVSFDSPIRRFGWISHRSKG